MKVPVREGYVEQDGCHNCAHRIELIGDGPVYYCHADRDEPRYVRGSVEWHGCWGRSHAVEAWGKCPRYECEVELT